MMCAAQAGGRGRSVLLVEHARKLGERIRISGGGRCNFTNLHTGAANFLSKNPHFCRSALCALRRAAVHRTGRTARHQVPREDPRPAVLRRFVAGDHRPAENRMRAWRREMGASLQRSTPLYANRVKASPSRPTRERFNAPRSWSPRAGSRCRRSAPRRSASSSRNSSAWTLSRRDPPSCLLHCLRKSSTRSSRSQACRSMRSPIAPRASRISAKACW